MKQINEVIAAIILKLASENPRAAFDAILKLVRENKALKAEIKALKQGAK